MSKYLDRDLQQAVDLVAAHGNVGAAARESRIADSTLRERYNEAKTRGFVADNQALASWAATNPDNVASPPSNGIPEGQQLRGLSTKVDGTGRTEEQWIKTQRDSGGAYEIPAGQQIKKTASMLDATGNVRVKWISTDRDAEQTKILQQVVLEAMKEQIVPLPPIESPQIADIDLLTLYTMTDCHVGMLAWDKETGTDWDLDIAERCLVGTLLKMIAAAPASAIGILNQLGDFLHFDSLQPLTPTNHHVLDADSRYQKVVKVAVRILMRVISAMLEKHESVHVKMMEGNHDPAGSVWLRVMFSLLYADNPRVTVDQSPNPYSVYQHGKTFLGFYHGHLAKLGNTPQIFAAQFRKEWGTSEFCYIHTGHKHHVEEKEHPGVKVIQHPTMSAPDAYAARGGWLSKRQATSMTYHRDLGEVARGIFIPVK